MAPEEKLKMLIGELQFQNVFLAAKLEEAQTRLLALEAEKIEMRKGNGAEQPTVAPPK